MLTQERLKELLHYDPETGVFTSRVFRSKSPVGKVVGTVRYDGYRTITIDKKQHLAHRLAWLYVHGYFPEFIDHADGDPSNNILSNLREATREQNQRNHRRSAANTSGVKGVAWDKERQKWIVLIRFNGRSNFIGRFDDLGDATRAVKEAREKMHGEFANNG